LRQAKHEEWKSVREKAKSILQEISKEGSQSDFDAYLQRSLIARRWTALN
jgi:hypothetical protein